MKIMSKYQFGKKYFKGKSKKGLSGMYRNYRNDMFGMDLHRQLTKKK
jgi:hypothetical protein